VSSSGFRWIAFPILLAMALAVMLVPSPGVEGDWYERAYADQPVALATIRKREALQRALTALEDATARVSAREQALGAAGPATPGITFRLDPRLTAGQRGDIMEIVRGEVDAVAPAGPAHRLVVVASVVPKPGLGMWGARYDRAVVLPTDATSPCAVVLRIPDFPNGAHMRSATDRLLGTCAFYAAFGAPGAGMHEWLLATNLRRAGFLQTPSALVGDTARVGGERYRTFRPDEFEACRAGRAEGCAEVFSPSGAATGSTDRIGRSAVRGQVETPELRIFSPTTLGSEYAFVTGGLLAALADSVGTARFAELWRSPFPPPQAYERQSGRPLTAWVEAHLATRMPAYHAGAAIPPLQTLLALGLVALAILVAIWRSPRVLS